VPSWIPAHDCTSTADPWPYDTLEGAPARDEPYPPQRAFQQPPATGLMQGNNLLKKGCNPDEFWSPSARSKRRLRCIRFHRIAVQPLFPCSSGNRIHRSNCFAKGLAEQVARAIQSHTQAGSLPGGGTLYTIIYRILITPGSPQRATPDRHAPTINAIWASGPRGKDGLPRLAWRGTCGGRRKHRATGRPERHRKGTAAPLREAVR
jgi:hypothetical protein